VRIPFTFKRAVFCNVLEDELHEPAVSSDALSIRYSPFQIVSLKLV
jgi:hypothetical protein